MPPKVPADAGEPLPVLWHFPISHFTEKARWALDYKGIPHRRFAPLFDYAPRAWWKTRQLALPILLHRGEAICDSTRIIAALEQWKPVPALYPSDPKERDRALALEDWLDEGLGPAIRTVLVDWLFRHHPAAAEDIFALGHGRAAHTALRAMLPVFRTVYSRRHAIRAETVSAGGPEVRAALDRIEAEIQPSGYLAGDAFSVADLTAAALFSGLLWPAEYPYPYPSSMRRALGEYRDSLSGHPAFRWLTGIYSKHRGESTAVDDRAAELIG